MYHAPWVHINTMSIYIRKHLYLSKLLCQITSTNPMDKIVVRANKMIISNTKCLVQQHLSYAMYTSTWNQDMFKIQNSTYENAQPAMGKKKYQSWEEH